MLIELQKLPDEAEITELYEPEWWHGDKEEEQVLALDGPLEVRVSIHRTGNKYILDGNMRGGILIRCDRCLEPYHHDVDAAFHLYLQKRPAMEKGETEIELLDDDMAVEFISGDELNLDEIVREQMFLSLPMKCVCMETCQGLCPVCGANRNREKCNCLKDSAHPAFQKLRNIKINDPRGE